VFINNNIVLKAKLSENVIESINSPTKLRSLSPIKNRKALLEDDFITEYTKTLVKLSCDKDTRDIFKTIVSCYCFIIILG